MIELLQSVLHSERTVGGLAGLAVGRGHENAGESADGAHHEQAHGALVSCRRHGASERRPELVQLQRWKRNRGKRGISSGFRVSAL